MNGHVTQQINGYFDHQLSPENMSRVESHLRDCAHCRKEFEQVRALSALLKQVPLPAPSQSTTQFISQLEKQLPVKKPSTTAKVIHLMWEYFPGGLVISWGFVQAFFLTVFVIGLAAGSGIFPGFQALLPGSSPSLLVTIIHSFFPSEWGEAGSFVLDFLSNPFVKGALFYALIQGIIGFLFLSWLASWYSSQSRRSMQIS